MKNRDIAILLVPITVFAIVGICAFISSQTIQRYHDSQREQNIATQKKFDAWVATVESGQLQLQPDRVIRAMRALQKVVESERDINVKTGIEIRDLVDFSAIGIFWQVAAVFIVRRRLRQP